MNYSQNPEHVIINSQVRIAFAFEYFHATLRQYAHNIAMFKLDILIKPFVFKNYLWFKYIGRGTYLLFSI